MKNLILKVLVLSAFLGFSSASAMGKCEVDNLQVGDEVSIYTNIDNKTSNYIKYLVTSRIKHPSRKVADLILIEGYPVRFPERILLSRVFCQDNILIIDLMESIKNNIRKKHSKKTIYKNKNGTWTTHFIEGSDVWNNWLVIKKTSLASK